MSSESEKEEEEERDSKCRKVRGPLELSKKKKSMAVENKTKLFP